MKFMRMLVPLVCLTACALFALTVGQASHTSPQARVGVGTQIKPQVVTLKNVESVKLTKATSLRNVRKVRTELLEGIDTILRTGSRTSGETTFVNTKVYKEAVDRTVYKTANSRDLMRAIPVTDLKELRALINTRFEESIRTGNVRALGEGQVNKSLFTGKIAAPAAKLR